ncbi:glycosyltransferase family 4 protein [Kitasatospora sp. NPDC051914]|uniref:glycosyltransferase family 4 protein n=1 Tax=Kitasatospora sp. NPDC051914 TaxID=3154945 RepID=UPI00343392EA
MYVAVVIGEGRGPWPPGGGAAEPGRSLAAAGHRVSLFARADGTGTDRHGPPGADADGPQPATHALPVGPARPLAADDALECVSALADQLARHWEADPPSVVHTCGLDAALAALAAAAAGPAAGPPIVHERAGALHGGDPLPAASAGRVHRLRCAVARRADLLLAHSAAEAELLVGFGADRRRVRTVPLGVDTGLFSPADSYPPPGPPQLLCLDGGRSRTGVDTVTRAVADLPGALLTVVGGDAEPSEGPVRRLPEVPHGEVPGLLRAATLLVTARPATASGQSVLEAMACGVPVVAVDGGTVHDLVVDGVTGVLLPTAAPRPLGRAVGLLLADPARCQALGIAGTDRARARHAWPRVADRLEQVYRTLTG